MLRTLAEFNAFLPLFSSIEIAKIKRREILCRENCEIKFARNIKSTNKVSPTCSLGVGKTGCVVIISILSPSSAAQFP